MTFLICANAEAVKGNTASFLVQLNSHGKQCLHNISESSTLYTCIPLRNGGVCLGGEKGGGRGENVRTLHLVVTDQLNT